MVGHHLPVIFTVFFSIENQDLVHVEGTLSEIVELERTSKGYMGIIYPNIHRIQQGGREAVVNVLLPC